MSTMTVRQARDEYLEENGFDTAAYEAETFDVQAFGRTYTFKNRPDRKRAIPLHDLHHAATGYGTDLVGEAEIGVWELRGGCRTPIVWALNLTAVFLGCFLAPRRLLRAFKDARGARTLYHEPQNYAALLDLSLAELRARLGVSPSGLVTSAPNAPRAAASASTH